MPRSGREIVLDPALHHARIGEDSGERVVDFVGHDSSHLSDGGHLFDLQHVLVSLLQLAGLFFDPVLECVGPGGDLSLRQLQAAAHGVERFSEVADLIVGLNGNLKAEFALGDALGSSLEGTKRVADDHPNEEAAEKYDEQQRHSRVSQHGITFVGEAGIDLVKRKIGVEHSQDLYAGGMRMAGGVGAGWLVLDRSDDSEHSRAVGAIHAETVGALEARNW